MASVQQLNSSPQRLSCSLAKGNGPIQNVRIPEITCRSKAKIISPVIIEQSAVVKFLIIFFRDLICQEDARKSASFFALRVEQTSM